MLPNVKYCRHRSVYIPYQTYRGGVHLSHSRLSLVFIFFATSVFLVRFCMDKEITVDRFRSLFCYCAEKKNHRKRISVDGASVTRKKERISKLPY